MITFIHFNHYSHQRILAPPLLRAARPSIKKLPDKALHKIYSFIGIEKGVNYLLSCRSIYQIVERNQILLLIQTLWQIIHNQKPHKNFLKKLKFPEPHLPCTITPAIYQQLNSCLKEQTRFFESIILDGKLQKKSWMEMILQSQALLTYEKDGAYAWLIKDIVDLMNYGKWNIDLQVPQPRPSDSLIRWKINETRQGFNVLSCLANKDIFPLRAYRLSPYYQTGKDLLKDYASTTFVDFNYRLNIFAAKQGCFNTIPLGFKNHRSFVLAVVEKKGSLLQFASNRLRNDPQIVKKAIKSDLTALQFASIQVLFSKELEGMRDEIFQGKFGVEPAQTLWHLMSSYPVQGSFLKRVQYKIYCSLLYITIFDLDQFWQDCLSTPSEKEDGQEN